MPTVPNNHERPKRVYFFGTCLVDVFQPDTGLAAISLIEREGVEVIFPQDQTCCGQPAWNSGFRREAQTVAARQIAAFPEPWPVVVPSASCAALFRNDYPTLFAGQALAEAATSLASRVIEWSTFMHRVLQVRWTDLGPPVTVVVHHSCSARRGLGSHRDALALLGQLAQVTLREPERADECCGFGGTFAVKQPALSLAMTDARCAALCATGASQLVSADWGCLLSLNGRLQRQQLPLEGTHLASFIRDRIHPRAGVAHG